MEKKQSHTLVLIIMKLFHDKRSIIQISFYRIEIILVVMRVQSLKISNHRYNFLFLLDQEQSIISLVIKVLLSVGIHSYSSDIETAWSKLVDKTFSLNLTVKQVYTWIYRFKKWDVFKTPGIWYLQIIWNDHINDRINWQFI